jgi:hypothetical protein
MSNNNERDTLTKFGSSFQSKCIASIFTDKEFLTQVMDIVHLDFFENSAHKWILNEIIEYFKQYTELPTLEVFKHKMKDIDNKVLYESIVNQLRAITNSTTSSDLVYIKEQFLEFCKNQKLKCAIIESADLLQSGEYEQIKHVVDEALKAGMERDDGHDYLNEIDERLVDDARDTVKTNWKAIDDLMDGGLGPGELGVFCASAGAGKCIGPNTEIDLQYEELGIEIQGNTGNPYVLWIDPFKEYDVSGIVDGVTSCVGWRIYNVLWELDNIRINSQT